MCFLANIGFYLNTSAKIYGCHFHADVGTFNNNHKRHLGENIYEIRPVLKVSGCFIWIFNWFSFAQFILLLRKMLFRKDEKWKKNKKNFLFKIHLHLHLKKKNLISKDISIRYNTYNVQVLCLSSWHHLFNVLFWMLLLSEAYWSQIGLLERFVSA